MIMRQNSLNRHWNANPRLREYVEQWKEHPPISRLEVIYQIWREHRLPAEKWWSVLGNEWQSCDNIHSYQDWLKPLFRKCRRLRLNMMNRAERATYDSLPELLTVYRGCFTHGKEGMSWSLHREVAEKFPAVTMRVSVEDLPERPLVCVMHIKKTECIYLGDRNEKEIVLATYTDLTVL
jgi:hypothetical protein